MYTSSLPNSRYIYVQVIAIYAQLLSHFCTSNAYHIRIEHNPTNNNQQQSVFNKYVQPNDRHSNRFEPDPAFGGVEDFRRIRKNAKQRKTNALPLSDIAFNSKSDPFLDNHYFEDFRKALPNEDKFHKQSKEVHKFHTHVSRIDENSNNNNINNNNNGPTKTNTGHDTYNSDHHNNHRKRTETVDNDGYDKNVDFKFVSDFPSERLIKNDEFFSPNPPTTSAPETDSQRKPKKSSFDYDDTIGEIDMNNKHTDEPDELKTELTNRDDVHRYHGDHMNQIKSRLNHVSTDPNYYQNHIRHDNSHDNRRPIYDDNQPKNFEDRFSLDPRTHINKMLNYFNSYPSTQLIDHNSNGGLTNNNHEHNQNIRHHVEAYPHSSGEYGGNDDNQNDQNRYNEFDSQREHFDDIPRRQPKRKQNRRKQEYEPFVQEITTIIPSDEQSFLFKPIEEPSAPLLPDIDLFIRQNNRKKQKKSPKMRADENYYDDFDEMPRQRNEEQTKKQVERELSKAAPISQYTPQDDSDNRATDDEKNANTGDDTTGRAKPMNFEKEVDISSADLENYFDKEFANFHSDKDPIEHNNKPDTQEDSEEPPVPPTLIPSHIYRDREQEDVLPEQPKIEIDHQIRRKPQHIDDNEGSRRSEKTEQELEEQEPDYRTSADFLRDHDDFLKKIDNENEKFKKESDEKAAKQQEEDEQEEGNDDNDNEEKKKEVDDGEKELDNDDNDGKQDGDSDDSDDTAEDSKVNKKKHESKPEEDKQQQSDNAEEADNNENNNNEAKEEEDKQKSATNDDDETEETKEEAVDNDSAKTDNDSDNKNDDTTEETKKVVTTPKDKKKADKKLKKNEEKAVMELVRSIKDKDAKCDDMDKCYDKLNDIAETKESNVRDHSPIVVPKAPKVPANVPKKILFMQTSIVSKELPASHSKQRLLETETNTISTPITTQLAVPLTVTVASNSRRVNRNADSIGVTQSPVTFDLKRITSNKKSTLNLFNLPVNNNIRNRRTTRE